MDGEKTAREAEKKLKYCVACRTIPKIDHYPGEGFEIIHYCHNAEISIHHDDIAIVKHSWNKRNVHSRDNILDEPITFEEEKELKEVIQKYLKL